MGGSSRAVPQVRWNLYYPRVEEQGICIWERFLETKLPIGMEGKSGAQGA
jgi:hypothetical protein